MINSLQGYRYWGGIGVVQNCESALTHYKKVSKKGAVYFICCLFSDTVQEKSIICGNQQAVLAGEHINNVLY